MSVDRLLKDFQAYVTNQCRQAEALLKEKKSRTIRPFVTMSRQAGAGGITVGQKLVECLNRSNGIDACTWAVFDTNLVEKVLDDHRLPQYIKKYMPEDKVSAVRDTLEELIGRHPSDLKLARQTNETILHLAHMGNVVIVGRGANILTRKLPQGIHVHLIGSLKARTQHVQDFYQMDKTKAEQFIQKEDKGRKKYLEAYFNKNIDDASLYDLVINTDHMSYERAAELIAQAVRSSCGKT